MQQRSAVYSSIFPDNLMMEAFGVINPSQTQKNEYFFNCWMKWKVNEIRTTSVTSPTTFKNNTKEKCNQIGLKEFWDFQIKGLSIRFKDSETKAFFIMATSGDGLYS